MNFPINKKLTETADQYKHTSSLIFTFNHYGYTYSDYKKCSDMIRQADYENSKIFSTIFAIFMAVFLLLSILGLVPHHYIVKYSTFLTLSLITKLATYLWDKTHKTYMLSSIRGLIIIILGFGVAESIYDSQVVATAILPLFILSSILSAGTVFEFFSISTLTLILFLWSSFTSKSSSIFHGDAVNGTSFYLLALIIHYYYQKSRISRFLIYHNLNVTKQQLTIIATFDGLSSALNRSTFSHVTNVIFRNPHKEIVVCLMDIDNFKYINDNFGHETGDFVIESVGESICESLDMPSSTPEEYVETLISTNRDYFGRLGGDEFFIIMRHDTSRKYVLDFIQYLQQCFYDVKLPENHRLSFSMGVVFVSPDEHDFHKAYKHADSALYVAKAKGKDQFAVYDG